MKDLKQQRIITDIRRQFERNIEDRLNLTRVTAPLFVKTGTGINDNLNGIETPVIFGIPSLNCNVEIVHSLAKWKRQALAEYNIPMNEGIYTNMNAIRRDEELDELHSIYVDQWDWEKVISKDQRNLTYLQNTVTNIYHAIMNVYDNICYDYYIPKQIMPKNVTFITSELLMKYFPGKTAKEAEYEFMKNDTDNWALFVIGIGGKLSNGDKYDGRSPDYDDWQLNGDLIFWDAAHNRQIEISSMGIRVDKESLVKQLTEEDLLKRLELDFHKKIMNDEVPLSIGGGIGQSRLCMWMLGRKHIKEVQESVW